jgi:hypothetical protein
MPRAIARLSREKRIRTLAQNLFVIEGPDEKENLRKAERALLRANPWLAKPEAYRAGAIVVVPTDIGLDTTSRVEPATGDLDGLLQEAVQRLKTAETLVRGGLERGTKDAEQAAKRLDDQRFVGELKKNSPEAGKLAAVARKNLADVAERNKKLEGETTQAIAKAIEEVERLRKLAERQG